MARKSWRGGKGRRGGKGAKERGIALVLSLFLMLAMSVVGASLMFLSQTETYASQNYRLMSQARYGGESGVHKAANYLLNTYVAPGTVTDPISAYNINVSPVTYNGNPVVLSATNVADSNYPVQAVKDAFFAAAKGSLANGTTTIGYAASAKLISMRQLNVYASATPATVQTWLITADGTFSGGLRTAQAEVTALLERQVGPAFAYAAFAVYSGCDALSWQGGGTTNSYDSAAALGGGGLPVTQDYGGNIGTNGNLTEAGNTTVVHGSLFTPRVGVGNCTDNNNPTAWTENGNASVTAGVSTLPQQVPFPAPDAPAAPPWGTWASSATMNLTSGGCAVTNYPTNCTESYPSGGPNTITLDPMGSTLSLGNLSLQSNGNGNNSYTLHLKAGTYNVNSFNFTGNAKIVVDTGPVIVNVAGIASNGSYMSQPVDFEGQMVSSTSYNPMMLQIRYAGTGELKASGGSDNAALIYAPKASMKVTGNQTDWYGAVIANTVTVESGAAIHYDRRLQKDELTLGNFMLSSFTWKKY